MNREIAERILDIQEKAMADAEYQKLRQEFAIYDQQLQKLYRTLPQEQLAVIMDYLGAGISLHFKLLEIACSDRERK